MARSSVREKSLNSHVSFNLDMAELAPASLETRSDPPPVKESSVTIRQFFPETWLWSLEVTGSNGTFSRKEKVPDSITDWILDAYCLSNKTGLAISQTQTLRVFQPLFVSASLPYSAIRGELFPVKATVFNYETTCVPVCEFYIYLFLVSNSNQYQI